MSSIPISFLLLYICSRDISVATLLLQLPCMEFHVFFLPSLYLCSVGPRGKELGEVAYCKVNTDSHTLEEEFQNSVRRVGPRRD